jgi:hypothetical protein
MIGLEDEEAGRHLIVKMKSPLFVGAIIIFLSERPLSLVLRHRLPTSPQARSYLISISNSPSLSRLPSQLSFPVFTPTPPSSLVQYNCTNTVFPLSPISLLLIA